MIKAEWLNDNTVYAPTDIDAVIESVKDVCIYCGDGRCKYLNIPLSFDTETSSFYDANGNKTAIVYVWMLGICGKVIVGRTWDEWIYAYERLVYNFRTYGNKRVAVCYIHNLSFDFQFLRKHHHFIKLFANDKYSPLYAQTDEGIEFRCSYLLSGYNLNTLAKNLHTHKIAKMVGDLDYRQIRHSQTPLTQTELGYCLNDAKIVCAYIDELITREGDISKIPLTKTGFVRRDTRQDCFAERNYRYQVSELTLTSSEFDLCKDAFMGGYTHANSNRVNAVIENVTSMDIISSYPSVLLAEQFPMSKPEHVNITSYKQLYELCKKYSCVFTITFKNVHPRYWFDFYLSASKCTILGNRVIANGRVVSADCLTVTITEVDLDIIQYMYIFDDVNVGNCICFKRDYLPTAFIKSMMTLYQRKTELKGVEGKEVEYAVIKENLNSFYGMTVTSPIRPINGYENDEWLEPDTPETEVAIQAYNTNRNRFLYYPWGIYVTAYARHNIWEAIIECGDDHIYTDTDSEKFTCYEAHRSFFEAYNTRVFEKHKRACKVHGIDVSMCIPKTVTGKVKQLGAFEIDGMYDKFKTLGAKRYLYEHEGKYGLTVAGLHKDKGLQYMMENGNPFEMFRDGLYVPASNSGRLTHTYINTVREGDVIDLYGVKGHYRELSGIHLEPTGYEMGLSGDFKRYLKNVKEGEVID